MKNEINLQADEYIDTYNSIYNDINTNNNNYNIVVKNKSCIKPEDNVELILRILGQKGILPRFGKAFYQTEKGYWVVNLENSTRLEKMGIRKSRVSLHRLVYICANGYRYHKDYGSFDIHHLCKNKWCMNPLHMIAVKKPKHNYCDTLSAYLLSNKGKYPPLEIRERFYNLIGKDITDRIIKKTLEFVI